MPLILSGPYTELVAPFQRGFSTAFCQKQTGRWSPTTGWTFDQDFRGLSYANMQALANVYSGAGIEYELTLQDGKASMRTIDTTGNITIDTWEVKASQVTKTIFENPIILANVTANDLAVLGYAAATDAKDLPTALANVNASDPGTTYTMPNMSNAYTDWLWRQVFLNSVESYFADQYSLTHTTSASNRGYYNVADVDVNCIYTQAQFYSEIMNASSWIFPAPPEIIGALNTVFSHLPPPVAPFVQGALKGGATRVTAANNRVNVTTEYLIENWSNYLYSLAT